MGRPKYRITPADEPFARRWIERKLGDPRWLGGRAYEAWQEYLPIEEGEVEALTAWGERWMRSWDWTQLKNAVRQARRRSKTDDLVTIQISRYAWRILQFWAKRDRCTFSEVIERRLGGKQ